MTESIGTAVRPGPREVFRCMQQQWLGRDDGGMDGRLAADVVIESPFAPPGRPRRFDSRDEFLAYAAAGRAALPPFDFEACRELAVHETVDPEVIVVEYELTGTVPRRNVRATASFVGVLRVREGQILAWREYQNVLAIAEALGQLPALVAGLSGGQPGTAAQNANV